MGCISDEVKQNPNILGNRMMHFKYFKFSQAWK